MYNLKNVKLESTEILEISFVYIFWFMSWKDVVRITEYAPNTKN